MKTLIILAAVLFMGSTAQAVNQYQRALWTYPYDIRTQCKQLNTFRDRKAKYVNFKFSLQCAEQAIADRIAFAERQSKLELIQAKTDWLEANKYSRGRGYTPWSE